MKNLEIEIADKGVLAILPENKKYEKILAKYFFDEEYREDEGGYFLKHTYAGCYDKGQAENIKKCLKELNDELNK